MEANKYSNYKVEDKALCMVYGEEYVNRINSMERAEWSHMYSKEGTIKFMIEWDRITKTIKNNLKRTIIIKPEINK